MAEKKAQPAAKIQDEFIALTSHLVSVRTTASRPAELARCADILCAWLKDNKISFRRFEHGGIPSILVGGTQSASPVLLLAHFDVIEGHEDLFKAEHDGNILKGRGSIDDKYAVALALLLYRNHLDEIRSKERQQGALPFMLLLTGDEESGGKYGAGFVSEHVSPEFCIAIDGGGTQEIITDQKGILRITLEAHGISAHGARPWLGENAAIILMKDCLTVQEWFKKLAAERNTDANDEYWYPTCNTGIFNAGNAVNQVPDLATAELDIRFTENDNPENLVQSIKKLVKSNVSISSISKPLSYIPSSYIEELQRHAPGATLGKGHGASDAHFFSELGIPCVVWGANGNNSQHGPEEHLLIDSAVQLYKNLDAFLRAIRKS